ncbi:thermonuclease family protein [Patulibacter minatonensis]|uniref:thermonuclease family protein n=1 Tax=Patulibacter minatonensis TaxID=298163 RepID=UPI0005630D5B|nr:thermonuclease family protein [Patulibacter minatonensis]
MPFATTRTPWVQALACTIVALAVNGCGTGTSGTGGGAPPGGAGADGAPVRDGGRVTRVVDGDTVHVRIRGGGDETVRLALVDAPESSTTRYGRTECGGVEATTFLRRLVDGREVALRRPGGEDRDRFGRTVAELMADGRSVDEQVVAAGWAKPFRVPSTAGGSAANRRIRTAADDARTDRVGVWRLCGGFERR